MSQAEWKGGRASSTAKVSKVAKLLRAVLLIFTSAEQGGNPASLAELSLRGKNNYGLINSDKQLERALSPLRFDCFFANAGDLLAAV